jgi:hypothetical protein
MIRLIVRLDDAAMAAHVGGGPQTTFRTFDIDHPEIEKLLRASGKKPNEFSYAILVGAELIEDSQ